MLPRQDTVGRQHCCGSWKEGSRTAEGPTLCPALAAMLGPPVSSSRSGLPSQGPGLVLAKLWGALGPCDHGETSASSSSYTSTQLTACAGPQHG